MPVVSASFSSFQSSETKPGMNEEIEPEATAGGKKVYIPSGARLLGCEAGWQNSGPCQLSLWRGAGY